MMRTWLSIGCVVLLAGCSCVTMQEPFPETPLTEEEQEQLTGAWHLEESGVYNIAFTTNGVPWVAWMGWEDEDFQLAKSRLHFTKHNDTFYVCMPVEPGETNQYFFMEFAMDDGKALLWVPDEDVFEMLVKKGILSGEVNSSGVELGGPAKEILEQISTHRDVFNYKEPIQLRKLR